MWASRSFGPLYSVHAVRLFAQTSSRNGVFSYFLRLFAKRGNGWQSYVMCHYNWARHPAVDNTPACDRSLPKWHTDCCSCLPAYHRQTVSTYVVEIMITHMYEVVVDYSMEYFLQIFSWRKRSAYLHKFARVIVLQQHYLALHGQSMPLLSQSQDERIGAVKHHPHLPAPVYARSTRQTPSADLALQPSTNHRAPIAHRPPTPKFSKPHRSNLSSRP